MSRWVLVLRRFIVFSALAFWIGGFTFYTGVVVQVGAAVLHSHTRQGFITQRVTFWMNLSGAIALTVLLLDLLTARLQPRALRRLLVACWVSMMALQVWLFVLHPQMDRLLNPGAREVLDEEKFTPLHTIYVWSATAQWAIALIYTFGLLWFWSAARMNDRQS